MEEDLQALERAWSAVHQAAVHIMSSAVPGTPEFTLASQSLNHVSNYATTVKHVKQMKELDDSAAALDANEAEF